MPVARFVADAIGVVTICLVAILVLLGLFCVLYSFYLHKKIHVQGPVQLCYFSGPWIIRIIFIFFAVWWGVGEIIRLSLLRREGRVLHEFDWRWQRTVCKCYIVSNLGFAEPCLFLTLTLLLRASLQRSGTLSEMWNSKTTGYVLLYCLPMFVLQLIVILIGQHYENNRKLPPHYINTYAKTEDEDIVALCTYPLLSTIFLGLFTIVLTTYSFLLGRQILHLVINKGLQKRVYTLTFSISGLFPPRVILLGLSVLSEPKKLLFDFLTFLAFLSLLIYVGVAICMLVYLPVADSLALRSSQRDIELRTVSEYNDTISLIANRSPLEESTASSPGRRSVALSWINIFPCNGKG